MAACLVGVKDGQEVPQPFYPYYQPRMTREQERALREQTEAALVWNGTGYEWKK